MVKIIRDLKQLQEIEPQWNALLKSSLNENVFQSFKWNYLWAKYFIEGKDDIFVITVYNDKSELEAIAPFYLNRFFLFFKSLMFISGDYSDYLDIIIKKDADKAKIYSEIFDEAIIKKSRISNIIYLKQASGEMLDEIKKKAIELKLKTIYKESGDCYYFDLPDDIKDYMGKFNSKQRYNILSRVEKANKNNIKFVGFSDIGDKVLFNKYLGYFFDLHQNRWNKKGKKGVFHTKKIRNFFTDLFNALFDENKIGLSMLVVGGNGENDYGGGEGDKKTGETAKKAEYNNIIRDKKIYGKEEVISSVVCFDCMDKRQVYLPGFDIKYSNYHPGIVLTYYIIKEAIDKKYKEFDFLKGGEDYKQRFGAVKRENYKVYIFKNNVIFYIYKISLFIKKEILEKFF